MLNPLGNPSCVENVPHQLNALLRGCLHFTLDHADLDSCCFLHNSFLWPLGIKFWNTLPCYYLEELIRQTCLQTVADQLTWGHIIVDLDNPLTRHQLLREMPDSLAVGCSTMFTSYWWPARQIADLMIKLYSISWKRPFWVLCDWMKWAKMSAVNRIMWMMLKCSIKLRVTAAVSVDNYACVYHKNLYLSHY